LQHAVRQVARRGGEDTQQAVAEALSLAPRR